MIIEIVRLGPNLEFPPKSEPEAADSAAASNGACPGCGLRTLTDGRCDTCGTSAAEYYVKKPWIVPLSQTVPFGDPRFDNERAAAKIRAQQRQKQKEDEAEDAKVHKLQQQRPNPIVRRGRKEDERQGKLL